MESRKLIGDQGEQQAGAFLEALGFQILAVNWRYKRFEVDIIALDQQVLVFVEVKVRKNEDYGMEHTLISPQKQKRLSQAAEAYIFEKKHQGQIRFDIIAIINHKLNYIKDAFWNY